MAASGAVLACGVLAGCSSDKGEQKAEHRSRPLQPALRAKASTSIAAPA